MSQERLTINELLDLPEEQQCSAETLQKLTTDDLKKLLKNYNMDEENCRAIEDVLNLRIPGFSKDNIYTSTENSYPALKAISKFYNVMGVIILVVGILGSIWLFSEKNTQAGVYAIILTPILSLSAFASSESIKVITDIASYAKGILESVRKND